jgi:hypothetical protein
MRGFGSSLEQISNKLLSAEAAVEVVKPGHRVFVGTANNAMLNLVKRLGKIEIRSEEGSYYVTLLFA